MEVQWYPGHMTKARRMMEENIRLVDLVIELVDARIPLSSSNPDIDALCRGKSRVVLLCKADLADPAATERFLEDYQRRGILAAAVDARERRAAEIVRRKIQEACREKMARDLARGIKGRPVRVMVAGIPNVGKSTFINSFAGRASTKTGNKPGVTRGKQWIRLGEGVELLDTPGILWPKFDSPQIGMKLALLGAVRDEILDKEELALWLLQFLEKNYPGAVREKYLGSEGAIAEEAVPEEAGPEKALPESVDSEEAGPEEKDDCEEDGSADLTDYRALVPAEYLLLRKIARQRCLLLKGGEPDTARAAAMLIDDCKNGRIGRISLDLPGDAQVMRESLEKARASAASRADASSRGGQADTARRYRKASGRAHGQQEGKNRGASFGAKSGAAGKGRKGPGADRRRGI